MKLPALAGITPEYNLWFEFAALPVDILLCIFLGRTRSQRGLPYRAFFLLLLATTFSDVVDIVSCAITSAHGIFPLWVHIGINTLYFFCGALLGFGFVEFVLSYAQGDRHLETAIFISRAILAVFLYILLTNPMTGYVFFYDAYGNYAHGPLFVFVAYLFPMIFVAFGTIFLLPRRNLYSAELRMMMRLAVLVVAFICLLRIFFLDRVQLMFFVVSAALWLLAPAVVRGPDPEEEAGASGAAWRSHKEALQ